MSSALRDTLIRVAYQTDKPKLRRELVAILKQADYPQEFIDWMQAKGPIFENPSTGNKVKFLSLDSHMQAVHANEWKPKWEQEKEDAKKKTKEPEKTEATHKQYEKYQTSEHDYHGKGASPDSKVKWQAGDRELVLPEKIRAQYAALFDNANYNTIKELLENIETALADPDAAPMYWESGYTPAGLKKLKKMLNDRLKDLDGRLYTDNAGQHGVNHDFGEETMDTFYDWRKAKPDSGRKLSWEQLREKFIKEGKLDAREASKVRSMSADEFKHMYLHVLDADGVEEDEEEIFEEGGKMAADEGDKATDSQIQFALDLAKEKGKDYSKSDLAKKTKTEISDLIDSMQKEKTVASEKQVSYAMDLLKGLGRKSPSKSSLERMGEDEISKLIDKLKGEGKKAADERGPEESPQEQREGEEELEEEEEDQDIEQKQTDEDLISVFDKPRSASLKIATYEEIRDMMIRTAYHTSDRSLKLALLRMLQAESKDPGDPSMDTEEEGEGEGYSPGEVLEEEETGEGPPDQSESELPGDEDMDDEGDYDAEDVSGELPPEDEEAESTRPPMTAAFREIRDLMVRSAYYTNDKGTRIRLLRMLQAI